MGKQRKRRGAAERARRASGAGPRDGATERGRWSSKRKAEAVLRLLRGEELEALSRELGVTAARLTEWRDAFLAGGEAHLKSRRPDANDDERRDLLAKIGDLTMRLEIHRQAIKVKGWEDPFASRRSQP